MSNFWACDVHSEHGEGKFNCLSCRGFYNIEEGASIFVSKSSSIQEQMKIAIKEERADRERQAMVDAFHGIR